MDVTGGQAGPGDAGSEAGGRADDVFVRRSSGLLRTAAPYDVFIFNIGLISVGIAVAFNQFIGPSTYPGSNVAVSSLIATVGMVAVGVAYYMWSMIFPRSGGNYVYQSRGLGPGVAFTMTFLETVILMFYAALAASLLTTVGLSAGFGVLGLISKSDLLASISAWFGSPMGIFVTGMLFILFSGLLPLFGMRRYFKFQRVMFLLAIVGTALALLLLLFVDRSTFVANFNRLTDLEYNEVINIATDKGWQFDGYGLGPTIAFFIWPLLPLLGGIQSIGIGGEIRRVSRSQFVGMLGSIVGAGLLLAAFAVLSNKVFGYEFQGAIAYNSTAAPDASTAVAPWFTLLAGIAAGNIVLSVIIVAGFAAWIYFWIPAELIYAQRTMLAWSFDRLAPERLSYVSPRYHTPVVAIILTVVCASAFMAVIAFTNYGTLVLVLGLLVAWGTTMLAGVFFPWTRKDLYRRSPVARYKIGPIPVMSVVNFLALSFMAWAFWLLWNDPIAAGHDPIDIGSNLVVLVLGGVLYLVMRAVRSRQGLNLELAFKQIPIE
jgi:basic amino acid/polyamine antiporter, APA family